MPSVAMMTGACVFAGLDRLVHPGIEARAMHEDDVRLRNRVRIVHRRFVIVRIDIRLEDSRHHDTVAANVLHEILNLRRRRRNRDLLAGQRR